MPPINSYAEFVSSLQEVCRRKNFELAQVGMISHGNVETLIYTVRVPPRQHGSLRICVIGSLHGDEQSGAYGILSFLSEDRSLYVPRVEWLFFPVANPVGFELHQRENALGFDLNRGWFAPQQYQSEQSILQECISQFQPAIVLSIHEDDEIPAFYLYGFGMQNSQWYEHLVTVGERVMASYSGRTLYGHLVTRGVVYDLNDGSFEHWASKVLRARTVNLEVPDTQSSSARLGLVTTIIKHLL